MEFSPLDLFTCAQGKKKLSILLLFYIIVLFLSALNSGNDLRPYILACSQHVLGTKTQEPFEGRV